MAEHVLNLLLNGFVAGVTAVGLFLALLGLRAWYRYGEPRLALLFLAFAGFLAQGLLLSWALFIREAIDDPVIVAAVGLSGASLLLVYFATLARPAR